MVLVLDSVNYNNHGFSYPFYYKMEMGFSYIENM